MNFFSLFFSINTSSPSGHSRGQNEIIEMFILIKKSFTIHIDFFRNIHFLSIFLLVLIYLKGREMDLPTTGLLTKCMQQLGLGPSKAMSYLSGCVLAGSWNGEQSWDLNLGTLTWDVHVQGVS